MSASLFHSSVSVLYCTSSYVTKESWKRRALLVQLHYPGKALQVLENLLNNLQQNYLWTAKGENSGFRRNEAETLDLLGCYFGSWSGTFRGSLSVPYSRVRQSKKNLPTTKLSHVTSRNNEGRKQSMISFFPLDVFHPSALKNYGFRLYVHATGCTASTLKDVISHHEWKKACIST